MHKILLRCVIGALLFALPLATHAEPQRRRGSASQRRPAARSTATRAPRAEATELAEARARLTDQIKLLSRFLYLYGRISGTVEAAEEGGSGRADGTEQTAERSRAALVANVRNVRAGLDDLTERFNRNASLTRYTAQVIAAGDLARLAESSIAAGNLDDAGRRLVAAVGSLTDALAAMR